MSHNSHPTTCELGVWVQPGEKIKGAPSVRQARPTFPSNASTLHPAPSLHLNTLSTLRRTPSLHPNTPTALQPFQPSQPSHSTTLKSPTYNPQPHTLPPPSPLFHVGNMRGPAPRLPQPLVLQPVAPATRHPFNPYRGKTPSPTPRHPTSLKYEPASEPLHICGTTPEVAL